MKRHHDQQSSVDSSSSNPPIKSMKGGEITRDGTYFNKVEGLGDEKSDDSWRFLSLRELLLRVNPNASIHFNFMIEPAFVLSQYPARCRQKPITFVVGERDVAELRQECTAYKNVTVADAALQFPYASHHAKLSMFESEDALHVMISTSNLINSDWTAKTQAFYYCRAPFIINYAEDGDGPSEFSQDLLQYLDGAYPSGSRAHTAVNEWTKRIKKADFSGVKDRIVGNYPGRFVGKQLSLFGHMKLRHLLEKKFTNAELSSLQTFIGQFSSIGSLGTKANIWLCSEFLRSLAGRGDKVNGTIAALKLIYPSVENVRESVQGYAAGGSLPYTTSTNDKQPWLKTFLHQWKSDKMRRTRVMPHAKSYAALDKDDRPRWLLMTSANLSHSAWGKLEKSGTQLFCRSYELGVLVCAKDHPEMEKLPIPFDLPLVKYSDSDAPFLVDKLYAQKDIFGFSGIPDVN